MNHGTRPVEYDRRDYDLHKTFGAALPVAFPPDYNADAGLWCPDQNVGSDAFVPPVPPLPYGCTDYTQADLCADEDQELRNPALLEAVTHANASGGGAMRPALEAAKKVFNRTAYFAITASPPLDFFDAIRLAMYSTKGERRSVSAATPFFREWLSPTGGVLPLPASYSTKNLPWHNWKVAGWKSIAGKPYLVCKMWCGASYGDHGYVYMSRELANIVFNIPGTAAFTLTKFKPTDVQTVDFDLVKWIVSFIRSLLTKPDVMPSPQPSVPIPPPSPAHVSRIKRWALAIQTQEGGGPTDPNTVHRNPGNLKYSPYTAALGGKPGPKGSDGGSFCVFDTYQQGLAALCQFLTDAANDLLKDYHQARTLKLFTMKYANIPASHPYPDRVAAALGVSVDINIKELL